MERCLQIVPTSGGAVEVVSRGGAGEAVLYFHGGHESATVAPAAQMYVDLGHRVVLLSRPGYGRTDVGAVPPALFAALVDEVRAVLGHERFVAVVGTSFGGPQAVEYAGRFPDRVGSLILHSAAPSTLPYPDSVAERLGGPVLFNPVVERFTWAAIAAMMRRAPTIALRSMIRSLSTRPDASWLQALDAADRREMRDVFCQLRSGRGFLIDLRYATGRTASSRRRAQQQVTCPTLVTASRQDGGVAWEHAEDFAATIPDVRLVEIPAASHLFWIGPTREQMMTTIEDFLATEVDRPPQPR